jgi:hypothetical protein
MHFVSASHITPHESSQFFNGCKTKGKPNCKGSEHLYASTPRYLYDENDHVSALINNGSAALVV